MSPRTWPLIAFIILVTLLPAACAAPEPAPTPTPLAAAAAPTQPPPTATPIPPTEPPPPTAVPTSPPVAAVQATAEPTPPPMSAEGQACVTCHKGLNPGIVSDWEKSKHYGESVDCFTCHGTKEKGDRPDAQEHSGYQIVVLVTPKDCEGCHAQEGQEFLASRHADAAKFIGSLDNILGEIVGGGPAANSGCKQCHGSAVAVVQGKPGELDPRTWPNTGIGRLNPDGSKGTCTACHSRHQFSIAQARAPEVCGKCHIGPDHPQYEVWWESKHGSRYYEVLAEGDTLNTHLPAGQWLPGRDYAAGPTCASCHISATPKQPVTHDVGLRISWTLRPVVSTKVENWEKNRAAMQDVCAQCHSPGFAKSFYAQFDALVDLYNTKYAIPAKTIMDNLTAAKKLTDQPFDVPLKWTYYELWHHEGRRARHGAAMAGPDYAWWHGLYEVSKHFYTEFLPEARALDPQIVDEVIDPMSEHDWFTKGLTKEELEQILSFYQERYGQ